ncbi:MAG: hypothetical protein H7308_04185, partial [Chthonomonadaceae bacterium]|nr:hypothetical protein [Chthonomonadaceae bacterium]
MKLNRRRLLASLGLTLLGALAFGCNNTGGDTSATTGTTGKAGTVSNTGGGNGNPQSGDTIKVGAYLS